MHSLRSLTREDGNARGTIVLGANLAQQERLLKYSGTWDSEAQASSSASSSWADSSSSDQRNLSMSVSDTATSQLDLTAGQLVSHDQASKHASNSSSIGIEGDSYFSDEDSIAEDIAMQSDRAAHNRTPFAEPWTIFARHTIDTILPETHAAMATDYTDKIKDLVRSSEQYDNRFRCSEIGCTISCKRRSDLVRHRRTKHPKSWTSSDVKGYRCVAEQCAQHGRLQLRIDKFKDHVRKMHPKINMSLHIAASEIVLKTANGRPYTTDSGNLPIATAISPSYRAADLDSDSVAPNIRADEEGRDQVRPTFNDPSWTMSSWLGNMSNSPDIPFSEITLAPEPRRPEHNLGPVFDQIGIALEIDNTTCCRSEQHVNVMSPTPAAFGLCSTASGACQQSHKLLELSSPPRTRSAPPDHLQSVPYDGDRDSGHALNRTASLRGAVGIPGYGNHGGGFGGGSTFRGRASRDAPTAKVRKGPIQSGKQFVYILDCLRQHCADPSDCPEDCRKARRTCFALMRKHHGRKDHNIFYCTKCIAFFSSENERDEHALSGSCRFRCVTVECPYDGFQPEVACRHDRQHGNSQPSIWKALFIKWHPEELVAPELELMEIGQSEPFSPVASDLVPVLESPVQAHTPSLISPPHGHQHRHIASRTSVRSDTTQQQVDVDPFCTQALRGLAIDLWVYMNGTRSAPSILVRRRYERLMSRDRDWRDSRTGDDAFLVPLIEGLWEYASKTRQEQIQDADLWHELWREAFRLLAAHYPEHFFYVQPTPAIVQNNRPCIASSSFGDQENVSALMDTSTGPNFPTTPYERTRIPQALSMNTQTTSDHMPSFGSFNGVPPSTQSFDPFFEGNNGIESAFPDHALYQPQNQLQPPSQHHNTTPVGSAFTNSQVPLLHQPQQLSDANHITTPRLGVPRQLTSHLTSSTQTRETIGSDLSNTGISAGSSFTQATNFHGGALASEQSRRSADEYLETPSRPKRPRLCDHSSPQI